MSRPPNCKRVGCMQLCHPKPDRGYYDYCGKSCAAADAAGLAGGNLAPEDMAARFHSLPIRQQPYDDLMRGGYNKAAPFASGDRAAVPMEIGGVRGGYGGIAGNNYGAAKPGKREDNIRDNKPVGGERPPAGRAAAAGLKPKYDGDIYNKNKPRNNVDNKPKNDAYPAAAAAGGGGRYSPKDRPGSGGKGYQQQQQQPRQQPRVQSPYQPQAQYQQYQQPPQQQYQPRRANVIHFYNRTEPYYEFTNFYEAPIKLEGRMWQTTEHYFQAQKFVSYPDIVDLIRLQRTPRDAFDTARKHDQYKRRDWETAKDELMLKAVTAKFTQHSNLAKLLLSTGDAQLVEHTSNDKYWGDGGDGSGQNMLGQVLMRVRDIVKREMA